MATAPTNVTVRQDLTTYAFAIMQDLQAAMAVADALAPVVPTGATTGRYNKFDTTQAFKSYGEAMARRAIGGQANAIVLLSDAATFDAQPYGLRVSIDKAERDRAAGADALLEQSKTRTLMINCAVSRLADIVAKVKAAVSAMSGKGDWKNANTDPIAEINAAILAVYQASGMVPNRMTIDFGAWAALCSNPSILARMPGADIASVTTQRLVGLLLNPNMEIRIVETATLYGGGLGNAAATKKGLLNGTVLVHYTNPIATPYDPSFAKTFSPSASLMTQIYSYREEPHLDWFENDWTADVQIVSALLCKRIDVTGAYEE